MLNRFRVYRHQSSRIKYSFLDWIFRSIRTTRIMTRERPTYTKRKSFSRSAKKTEDANKTKDAIVIPSENENENRERMTNVHAASPAHPNLAVEPLTADQQPQDGNNRVRTNLENAIHRERRARLDRRTLNKNLQIT